MKSKYFALFDLVYQTNLPVADCITRILSDPHEFPVNIYGDNIFLDMREAERKDYYDCELISETALSLVLANGFIMNMLGLSPTDDQKTEKDGSENV